ncbi:MAG: carboxylesterase/lipase family protein [Fibrobacteraceae bacterium]|nr:carboxylesterase/lipase family protein [Fibrobacteraceae bacterium]
MNTKSNFLPIYFALCCALFLLSGCNKEVLPIVQTSGGTIEGYKTEDVFVFKGIPYAESERFMPSVPTSWDGVKQCKEYGPWAKQAERDGRSSEDGNFLLNIFTKGLNDEEKRPIMMWIHGGGFASGSANADPTEGVHLAQKDVVLVSINHRLDVLGFLDLSDFGGKWEQTVNVGMIDIINALKWTKENAETFGGDPENITIFGESGGGGKVGTLLCMPEAKGLFQKAIIESGAKVNITTSEVSKQLGKNVVAELGLTADNLDEIQKIDFDTLLKVSKKCQAEILGPRTPGSIKMWGYCPTNDGKTLLQQPYTPEFSELAKDIPVMIGTTFNELERKVYNDSTFNHEKAEDMLKQIYGDEAEAFKTAFHEAFPEGSEADMVGIDSNIRALSLATADAQSCKEGQAPIYVYLLTWVSDFDTEGSGCYHSLDIPLAFNNPYDERYQVGENNPKAEVMANIMSDMWVSFARNGKPSAKDVEEWVPYTKENRATMILDNKCGMKYHFDDSLQEILYKRLK